MEAQVKISDHQELLVLMELVEVPMRQVEVVGLAISSNLQVHLVQSSKELVVESVMLEVVEALVKT